MSWLNHAVKSSIGAKTLMAITGLMLSGFLLGHISGNLLIFAGPDAINAYAEGLRKFPALLWLARIGLIAAFFAHMALAVYVTRANRAARPVKYAFNNTVQASYASRSMFLTGLVILAFVCFHLAHFTWRATDPVIAGMGDYDVYRMVVYGFKKPTVSAFYLLAMAAIGLHLSHGLGSVFQTLGLNHPRYNKWIRAAAPAVGFAVAALFASIPLCIYLGFLK